MKECFAVYRVHADGVFELFYAFEDREEAADCLQYLTESQSWNVKDTPRRGIINLQIRDKFDPKTHLHGYRFDPITPEKDTYTDATRPEET